MDDIIYNINNHSSNVLNYINNNYKLIEVIQHNNKYDKIILKVYDYEINKYAILKLFLNGRSSNEFIIYNLKEKCNYIIYPLNIINIDNSIIIKYKFYKNGDLFEYLLKNKLTELEIHKFSLQILNALIFLNKYNIVHMDLKIENIIIDDNHNIKLIDFEFCKIIKKKEITKIRGTYDYLPPESVFYKICSKKNDYWCYGIIIYILLTTNQFDISTYKIILKKLKISNDLTDLINGLLNRNYKNRFNINDIINNKWINKNFYKKKKKIYIFQKLNCFKFIFRKNTYIKL